MDIIEEYRSKWKEWEYINTKENNNGEDKRICQTVD